MGDSSRPPTANPLGNASLILGISSAALVFGLALCALTAVQQGWIRIGATPLFVCGGSSAFLGLLAILTGVGGLFGSGRPRGTAIIGIVLGLVGICMFFGAAAQVGGGG